MMENIDSIDLQINLRDYSEFVLDRIAYMLTVSHTLSDKLDQYNKQNFIVRMFKDKPVAKQPSTKGGVIKLSLSDVEYVIDQLELEIQRCNHFNPLLISNGMISGVHLKFVQQYLTMMAKKDHRPFY